MTEKNSKARNLPLTHYYNLSGHVEIIVKRKHLAVAMFNLNKIVVKIDNEDLLRSIIQKLPVKIKTISLLNKLSTILYKIGLSMEIWDNNGTLLKLGIKTYSPFRKVIIRFRRIRRYIK